VLDREQLVELLTASSSAAARTCVAALEEGAQYLGFGATPTPVAEALTIYERRVRHLESIGRTALNGFEVIEALKETAERNVWLVAVNLPEPPTHFLSFVAEDRNALIGCLAVDETDNPNFFRVFTSDTGE
jgi:hypothetical protein